MGGGVHTYSKESYVVERGLNCSNGKVERGS